MRANVRVCAPRYLQIGGGAVKDIASLLHTIGDLSRPLIVTDTTMVQIGVAARVAQLLLDANCKPAIFDKVMPDPTDTVVLAGIEVLKAGNHDCVIGLGGGSPLDAAKAIAVMSQHSKDIFDYRPPKEFSEPGLPLIAIPTTAGTGSEVTHHTVLIHEATREKISCRGEAFVPTAAVVDYELTMSKPARLTADNALDTLTHAIEAYVSKKRTLYSDRMALDCMRLVGKFIGRAYATPGDKDAREGLMFAATLGGLAFTNASIGLVHAMSRPLGSSFHVPHGMSNAMLLPAVTQFSLPAAVDRYAECARAIGLAAIADNDQVASRKLVDGLKTYNQAFAVPSMIEFGINKAEYLAAMERMAEEALRSGSPNNNPRVPTKEEIVALYEEAISEHKDAAA